MSERKSFVLAPSKFGKPSTEDASSSLGKPKFTGFKQSKLSVLADSSITNSTNTANSALQDNAANNPIKTASFSFTPLTKSASAAPAPPFSSTAASSNLTTTTAAATANKADDKTVACSDDNSKTTTTSTPSPKQPVSPQSKQFPVFGDNLRDKVKNVGSVFGENLNDKVLLPDKDSASEGKTPEKTETKDLQFSSVTGTPLVARTGEEGDEVAGGGAGGVEGPGSGKTLSESAEEYTQQSNSNKRKYEEVAVVTGEEEESNVLKCAVKLYLFDKENRTWTERGRGTLRLNDSPNSTPGHIFSRLVMRTHGSLRVVLNTKLWKEMVCEKVNDRNIRISAWDDNVIRIFLVTCSQKDADTLFHALECRLNQLKQQPDKDDDGGEETKDSPAASQQQQQQSDDSRDENGEPSTKKMAKESSE